MRNPFEFGRELTAEELVDRETELDQIGQVLLSAGKLFLIGPRRFGKTSLLHAAAEHAERAGAVVIRHDAQAFPTQDQLAARLVADTASRLTGTIDKARIAIREFFASVRPTATFDATNNKWSVALAGAPGRETGLPLLADILDGIELAAAKSGKAVSVIIDEFQEIVQDGGVEAEEQIRSAVQRHMHVGYVFAGSSTRMLADMVSAPNRPFYRIGSIVSLGAVPRNAFAAFLERGFAAGDISVATGAADAILDCAEEVPYNVQALAHACWAVCRAGLRADGTGEPTALTPDVVKQTRDAEALRLDPIYTQLWTSLTSTQRRALIAVVRNHDAGLSSTEIAREYDMPVTTMQRAVQALEAKQMIREQADMGNVKLRLEDPLFGAWVTLVINE